MVLWFDLRLPSYVHLKVAWKCHSGTLGGFRSGSEKTNGATKFHFVGSYKSVWASTIWEPYQNKHGWGFPCIDPAMLELHWRKLSKTLVYQFKAQWSHRGLKKSSSKKGIKRSWRHGNTTKAGTEEGFSELTHQCESCIEGNWAKPYLRNRCNMESLGHANIVGRAL